MATAGINFDELIFEKILGEGAFSRVYAATLHDRAVAVKQLRLDLPEADVVRFIHEVAVMREVSHPNLVGFVGSVWEPRCATFVTPVWDDRLPHLPP